MITPPVEAKPGLTLAKPSVLSLWKKGGGLPSNMNNIALGVSKLGREGVEIFLRCSPYSIDHKLGDKRLAFHNQLVVG